MYTHEKFRKKWAIAFRKYLVEELDQNPRNSIAFISDEKVLLNELVDVRKLIRKDTKEARIKEMRQIEENGVRKLIKHLGSQENYLLLQEFAGQFFSEYRAKHTDFVKPSN